MRSEKRSMSRSIKMLPGSTPVWFTRTSNVTPTSMFSQRMKPMPFGPHRLYSTTRRARRSQLQTREQSSASFLERISHSRGRTRQPMRTSTCSRAGRTTWSCRRRTTQSSCASTTWPGILLTLRSARWTSSSTSCRYNVPGSSPIPHFCVFILWNAGTFLQRDGRAALLHGTHRSGSVLIPFSWIVMPSKMDVASQHWTDWNTKS